jgi:hypothetical protein
VDAARVLARVLRGDVGNVAFRDLVHLLHDVDFVEVGGRGSYRVFARAGISELVSLQQTGGQAKPYQVRQVVRLVRRYDLQLKEDR